jgi:hypothetical protein
MKHHEPNAVSRKLDPAKQTASIEAHEDPLNHLGDDEAVLFVDAVRPTHAMRPGRLLGPEGRCRGQWRGVAAGTAVV